MSRQRGSEQQRHRPSSDELRGVGGSLSEVVEHGSRLIVDRLELMQYDLREGGRQLGRQLVFWALAGIFALGVVVAASAALGLALRPWTGDALAALAVALCHALVAAALVKLARRPQAASAADSQALVAPAVPSR